MVLRTRCLRIKNRVKVEMPRQKGGAFTHNGRTYTAEQILDKFSRTYLEKHEIELDPSIYEALMPFVREEDIIKWFIFNPRNPETRLFLNDADLTQEGIDRRIYTGILDTETLSPDQKPIFTLPPTPYIFNLTLNGEPYRPLAFRPFLEKQPLRNNEQVPRWKVFVKDPVTLSEIFIELEIPAEDIQTALETLFFTYHEAIVVNPILIDMTSVFQGPNEVVPYDDATLSEVRRLLPKLFFLKNNAKIRPIYCEQSSDNPMRYFFHPHNLLNFLPRKEEKCKELFEQITAKLNELTEGGYIYSIDPDKFYHIHVSKLPGEDSTLLLTMHAAYEDVSIDPPKKDKLADYVYIDGEGREKRSRRPGSRRIVINGPPRTPLKDEIHRERRLHNAFILLKSGERIHPLYKVSQQSQVGNPFLSLEFSYRNMLEAPFATFPFNEQTLGEPIFDIDHLSGKGVMIIRNHKKCTTYCDDNEAFDEEARNIMINLVTNPRLSSPIEPGELDAFRRNFPNGLPAAAAGGGKRKKLTRRHKKAYKKRTRRHSKRS